MPNWASNSIRILVPDDRAEALKAALSGPADWWLGVETRLSSDTAQHMISGHEIIALRRAHPDLEEKLQALGRPEWLPMTDGDLAEFSDHANDLSQHPCGKPAIISFPGFLPLLDIAQYRSFSIDPNRWRKNAIGIKWTPDYWTASSDGGCWQETRLPEGRLLEARADTPWCGPSAPLHVIRSALDAHDAEAIWFASEEGNALAEAHVLQEGEIRCWSWEGDDYPTHSHDDDPDIVCFDQLACEEMLAQDGVREQFLFSLGIDI